MQPKTTALVSLNFSDSRWSFSWGVRPEKPHFQFWPNYEKNNFENNVEIENFDFHARFFITNLTSSLKSSNAVMRWISAAIHGTLAGWKTHFGHFSNFGFVKYRIFKDSLVL